MEKTLYETWIKEDGKWRRCGFRLRREYLADKQTDLLISQGIKAETRVYVPDTERLAMLNEFGGGLPEDKMGL